MKKLLQFTSIVICSLLLCFSITPEPANAAGSDIVTIGIELQYGQTDARNMLQMVNAFRTNPDEAWAWSSDDSTKSYFTDLSQLQYDYELEKVAMLRAAEVALSHSHTRPNGTSCFTAFENYPNSGRGENIAAGYPTAASVFEGWQEKNDPYSGQGHRRNMLSASFNAIGIGHVYYNGMHYWVQEFAAANSPNTAPTPANDSQETVSLEVLSSNMANVSLTCSTPKIEMKSGDTTPLPNVSMTANFADHFPGSNSCPISLQENTSAGNPEWTSSNHDVVTVSADGTIHALAKGTATLTVSWNNLTAACEVTVQASPDNTDAGNNTNSGNEPSNGNAPVGGNNNNSNNGNNPIGGNNNSSNNGNTPVGGNNGNSGNGNTSDNGNNNSNNGNVSDNGNNNNSNNGNTGNNNNSNNGNTSGNSTPDGGNTPDNGNDSVSGNGTNNGNVPANGNESNYGNNTDYENPPANEYENDNEDDSKSDDANPDNILPKSKIKDVQNSAKGKIKIKWKKITSADGYQIVYSTSKSFSSSKTKNANGQSSSKTIKGLKKGKTYYVRVRAYTQEDGEIYYGNWSNIKKVKIKK